MTITNITDRERALSAEVQQLKEELLEQARIVGMSTDREYALAGKIARQQKALNLALAAIQYREGGWSQFNPVVAAIQEALAEQPAQQQEFECPRCGHCCPSHSA